MYNLAGHASKMLEGRGPNAAQSYTTLRGACSTGCAPGHRELTGTEGLWRGVGEAKDAFGCA